ncbi:hypothetical protein P8452_14652 [Trifolium repens]|nr:hypothetical protein P8452_14652 [Trifolium repens]
MLLGSLNLLTCEVSYLQRFLERKWIDVVQSDYDRVQLESLMPDLMCLDTTKKFIGWNKLSNEVSVVIVSGMYIMEHVD